MEGFRAEFPADRLNINGALNEIRSVSRELVAAGIRNIQFGNPPEKEIPCLLVLASYNVPVW